MPTSVFAIPVTRIAIQDAPLVVIIRGVRHVTSTAPAIRVDVTEHTLEKHTSAIPNVFSHSKDLDKIYKMNQKIKFGLALLMILIGLIVANI